MSGATQAARRPGLRMRRPDLSDLPPLEALGLPAGYSMRLYRPGDEVAWAAIMNTGIGSDWTAEKAREKLTACPQFDPEGLYFVEYRAPNGAGVPEPVGSACAWTLRPEERTTGVLHMVCVLPEHRGKRLSYALCLAVLHRFRDRGFRDVILNTGDFRVAAVKVYLDLGFHPVYIHPENPQQWAELERMLGPHPSLTPVEPSA